MNSQTIVWIALPNGIDRNAHKLRISVFVSPRLAGDPPLSLAQFPGFVSWPDQLQPGAVSFSVQSAGVSIPATITSNPPDAQLWKALFNASTAIRPHTVSNRLAGIPVLTYPHAQILSHVRTSVTTVFGASPTDIPSRQVFTQAAFPGLHKAFGFAQPPVAPIAPGTDPAALSLMQQRLDASENLFSNSFVEGLHGRLEQGISNGRALAMMNPTGITHVFADSGSQGSQFAQAVAFHHRSANAGVALPKNMPGLPEQIDFHQSLTALAEFPELMRRLGLVIDLEIDESALPASPQNSASPLPLRVVPAFSIPLTGTNYSPFTAYILEGEHLFLAAPRPPVVDGAPEFVSGMFNLARSDEYQVVEIDVDDAALKSVAAVSANTRLSASGNTGDSGGLPALHSSGIGIARAGQADVLSSRCASSLENNARLEGDLSGASGALPSVHFFAEDLVRGWRADVLDSKANTWFSLHRRTGTYTFLAHPSGSLTIVISDEGALQPSISSVVGNDGNPIGPEAYIHESLFQWRGWSLAANRPGKAIMRDGSVAKVANQAQPGGIPMEVNFVAEPGTLPRLRFGGTYQFRLRAVDLAGNSLSIAEATDALAELQRLQLPLPILPASAPLTYKRIEPVISPLLVPRARFTEGESNDLLVIRSNRGLSSGQYAAQLNQLVAGASGITYLGVNERHVTPPKATQSAAERFGFFDSSFGSGIGVEQTYNLAAREKGSLIDSFTFDATGNAVPLPAGSVQLINTDAAAPPPDPTQPPSAKNPPRGFAVHSEPRFSPTYLPDPLSRGASLFDLPGMPANSVASVDGKGALVTRPMNVPIQGRSSVSQIDFGSASLWPGMLPFRLQLADPSDTAAFPIPVWNAQERILTVFLPPGEQATLKLSSFLQETDVDVLGVWQWLLEQGLVSPTTNSLDLATFGALWLLTPPREIRLVHAVQQPVKDPFLNLFETAPREPGTTFAYIGGSAQIDGKSTAKLDLIASWVDRLDGPALTRNVSAHVFDLSIHLPEDLKGTNPTPDPETVPFAVYDATTDTVTFQPKPPGDESGRRFLARHEFGDTKHRQVFYRLVATSRFREYFPPQVQDLAVTGNVFAANIPSSARPPAPSVIYTLPVFAWTRTATPDGSQARVRKTAGARVYLDRPWFATGDGEQLAVVLADPANYPPNEKLSQQVTQWGVDPIWDAFDQQTGKVTGAPVPEDFGGIQTTGLPLDESPVPVNASSHDVQFDNDRGLWYCDIPIDPGSVYCPFVRMALARFQPNSLPGLKLSRVVLADFVQLPPQRSVSLQPVVNDPNSFALSVSGLSYAGSAWSTNPTEIVPTFSNFDLSEVLPPQPPEMTPPDLIHVSLEQRIAGTHDDAGWAPSTQLAVQNVVAAKADRPGIVSLWTGLVTLPASRQPGQFRIVIREYEQLFTDDRTVETVHALIPGESDVPDSKPHRETLTLTFAPGAPTGPTPKPGRMVFGETIEF